MGKGQLDDHKQDDLIISKILVGTVWDFVHAKCSLRCWIEKCGSLLWSCCHCNAQEKAGEEKRRQLKRNRDEFGRETNRLERILKYVIR